MNFQTSQKNGENTRDLFKNNYNNINKSKMDYLKKNLKSPTMENIFPNNDINKISNDEIINMRNNYNNLQNNSLNYSINNNPIPNKYPTPAITINKENPIFDKNFKTNNNDFYNIYNSSPHHNLNKNIQFNSNSIPIPNIPLEQKKLYNNNPYTPEIGDKRKLSNIIFNGINKSLNMINKNTITENQIDYLLHKLNLHDKSTLSPQEMKKFSQELKLFINQDSNNNLNISNNPTINNSHTISESLYEKETKYIEYLVTIDSNDRNTKIWKYPNEFTINFSPDSDTNFNDIMESNKNNVNIDSSKNKGYINRSFNNIESIELVEVILPNINENSVGTVNYKSKNNEKSLPDNYDNFPYIILEIEELGSLYEGTNNNLCRAFAILSNFDLKGNFRYYSFSKHNKIIKKFNPRIGLNKITVRFKTPYPKLFSGNSNPVNLFDFGIIEKIKGDSIECESPSILITLKITCIQVSLDTMYINPK